MRRRAGTTRHPQEIAVLNGAIREVGTRIRLLRLKRHRTLKHLADDTGLSLSMISMVERGRANPSIGTLVAIAAALGIPMVSLFGDAARTANPVIRAADQPVVTTRRGVRRRLLIREPDANIEVAENTYAPGTASADVPVRHLGKEMGIVLDGALAVEVGGERYLLHPGDAVVLDSPKPHRFVNAGRRVARTLWINVHGSRWESSKGGLP